MCRPSPWLAALGETLYEFVTNLGISTTLETTAWRMDSGAEREGSEEEGGEGGRELRVQVPTVHIAAARSRGEPADVIGYIVFDQ